MKEKENEAAGIDELWIEGRKNRKMKEKKETEGMDKRWIRRSKRGKMKEKLVSGEQKEERT